MPFAVAVIAMPSIALAVSGTLLVLALKRKDQHLAPKWIFFALFLSLVATQVVGALNSLDAFLVLSYAAGGVSLVLLMIFALVLRAGKFD